MDLLDRIEFLKSTIYHLQQGNLVQAKKSLQKNHQYFQDLTPCELSKQTLQEIEVINKAEEISIGNVAWSLRTGAILLPQTSSKNNVFVRFVNVVGAVALITIYVDIAEKVLDQLKEYIEQAEESVVSLGVALNNLGCVYIVKGSYQKAKFSLQRALEVVKEGKQCVTAEETIVTIGNNLRLVYQAQRSHIADFQLQNVSRFPIQPRIIAVVYYNEALTSVYNRNLRRALGELENLKKFCETELDQSKGLLTCILLKIRSVCLMLQASNASTTAIDSKILTLQGLKELVDVSTDFSLDFLVTIVETVADIHLYQGNLDLVCSYFSYLVPVVRERCGADHPTLASILSKQGIVFLHLENVAHSRQCFTAALEIFTGTFGAVHPDVLECNAGLARLELLAGSEEKSIIHSQRVLENVERICQVSFERQLKPNVLELYQRGRRALSPDTDGEEQGKCQSLASEFGVEIARVLNQYQPGDLDDCPGVHLDSEDCVDSSVSQLPEDLCAKLCFNWLKAGLRLFNLGVKQSVAFLFLSCTYASMLYDHCDCSEVILVKVIFLVCHLKSKTSQTFPEVQERLKTEFGRLKNFIEEKANRVDKPGRKTIFFDKNTNLMIALALVLQSFIEMEMYEMVNTVHSLFTLLSNQQSPQITHVLLVEEIRFALYISNIQCRGKQFMHDLIFLTPLGVMYNRKITDKNDEDAPYNFQSKELTKSQHEDDNLGERGSTKIFKTLVLKSDNTQWKGPCRFLVECPITRGIDVSALNHINAFSVNALEDSLPHLLLCSHQNIEFSTQYFIELELLDSSETSLSGIYGRFSLLKLLLSAAKDRSEFETQSPVLVNTENTCEGSLEFILQDIVFAKLLFGKLLKQILTNEDELGEVVNVVVKDSQLVFIIQGPPIGQIVMQCHENTIKVRTQLIHLSQSLRKVEIVQEEVPLCNCSLIEMVIADKMEKCARNFGIHFETQSDKSRCIASNLLGNARDISMRGHQMLELQHKAERPGRFTSPPPLPLRQSFLSESWTQTDSLSIPSTSDLSTQTDLSHSDESKNAVEPTSSSSEVSSSSSLPSSSFSLSSSSSSLSSPSSSSGEESTEEISSGPRSEPAEKGKSSVHSVSSCASELKKSGREVPKFANSEEESFSMAYPSVLEFKYTSNDTEKGETNQPPPVLPLNLKVETNGKLCESKKHLDKCIHTDDWLRHSMDDEVDGSVKSAARNITEIQNCQPHSSTGSVEPPFQRERAVADNLPRLNTDKMKRHGGAVAAATTSRCNDDTDEDRPNKECKIHSRPLKVSQERKSMNEGDLSGRTQNTRHGTFLGFEGGGQDPSCSERGLSYKNLESISYWNDKDAKPEKVRPRGDDMQNTIDEKESNSFGINPCFLARHADDSSITTAIDDIGNTKENANGWSSKTFSRHQGSSCFNNEQGSQSIYSFQAPSFGSGHLQTLSSDVPGIVVVPPYAVANDDTLLAQTPLSPQQRKVNNQCTDPVVQRERNCDFKVMNGNPARVTNTTTITQGMVSPETEISALPQGAKNRNLTWERRTVANQDTDNQGPLGVLNNSSLQSCDDSLADLERRVAETCSFVQNTLKEREVKEKAMKEKERRKKEERARKEQQARERREREAREV
ncbi:uncharacterized protein LOC111336045 isoform X1 [Stylophora pistillata]|uniref:uncharacterized protein LOC111336045 isoform X1 n=1 Tax=Stylophora pistillata TaxID=50429 RepID=UPI000C03D72B|nr:uncharacterized protein LOC111336045 isoform X1 [Stylophora pistillata]XP_022797796.1 uncharacterized protein LOC111336045 isoform X1 [Stylophora pistillata]XP_022797798.1 uncharacterized protein LOC111336045 isoform X1 [Stylophora pistillata]XP_022797799.1 uncharacterized protein LOC111336045 isoform X1 [Stylophora pistillata]XP_022797800.1 uncharacterized protein LOC111336045 isoform X1 [Stylophora pistillata]XP_022797801.1 uncharacterized protein LOC111336045 isoform X1 [Stylophora pisti